jgi:hypothetical protein
LKTSSRLRGIVRQSTAKVRGPVRRWITEIEVEQRAEALAAREREKAWEEQREKEFEAFQERQRQIRIEEANEARLQAIIAEMMTTETLVEHRDLVTKAERFDLHSLAKRGLTARYGGMRFGEGFYLLNIESRLWYLAGQINNFLTTKKPARYTISDLCDGLMMSHLQVVNALKILYDQSTIKKSGDFKERFAEFWVEG